METTATNYSENLLDSLNLNDKYLDNYVKEVDALFKDDKTAECFELLKIIESKIENEEIIYENVKNQEPLEKSSLLNLFKSDPLISALYEDKLLTERCLGLYKIMNTTKPEREYNGIKTWFKSETDVESVTICGRTTVTSDLLHLLSVLAEMELMKTFIDRFEDLTQLGSVTPFRPTVHAKILMPLTISNRDLMICGFGLVNKSEKTIFIPVKSIKAKKYFDIEIPQETSSYKRINLNMGFFHIKHEDLNTYTLSYSYNVDPKVFLVPWWIVNKVIKEMSYYVLHGLKTQIENPKNRALYKKRREERKDFYAKIEKEMQILDGI